MDSGRDLEPIEANPHAVEEFKRWVAEIKASKQLGEVLRDWPQSLMYVDRRDDLISRNYERYFGNDRIPFGPQAYCTFSQRGGRFYPVEIWRVNEGVGDQDFYGYSSLVKFPRSGLDTELELEIGRTNNYAILRASYYQRTGVQDLSLYFSDSADNPDEGLELDFKALRKLAKQGSLRVKTGAVVYKLTQDSSNVQIERIKSRKVTDRVVLPTVLNIRQIESQLVPPDLFNNPIDASPVLDGSWKNADLEKVLDISW